MELSETLSNVIENIACRLAESTGGEITPHYILPYLPVSLGIVEHCLNNMVDGASITASVEDNLTTFTFSAYQSDDKKKEIPLLDFKSCVACDADFTGESDSALCNSCRQSIRAELNRLAEHMGWPAQAVYEHEILYNITKDKKAMHPAQLAACSRFTLRSMSRKLEHLADSRFATREALPAKGITTYQVPPVTYPRKLYRANMDVIMTYPASVMEEVQLKLTRIFITLGCMLLAMLAVAFWGVPFLLLLMLFAAVAPITAISIWRRKTAPEEE